MSTRLIYNDEDRLLPWAAKRIGIACFRDDAKAIGLERNGKIAAVAVYDTFSEVECNVHLASDGSKKWMNKEFLIAGFAYPFIQCGFESMTGIVSTDNEETIDFDLHIGWKKVGIRRRAMPGGKDVLLIEMLRTECRWIPEEFRK